jgi:hypothetical protein
MEYSAGQLACPVARRRSSGRIEADLRCLVGEAAAWPSWILPSGTLGLLPEWFEFVFVYPSACLACHA